MEDHRAYGTISYLMALDNMLDKVRHKKKGNISHQSSIPDNTLIRKCDV